MEKMCRGAGGGWWVSAFLLHAMRKQWRLYPKKFIFSFLFDVCMSKTAYEKSKIWISEISLSNMPMSKSLLLSMCAAPVLAGLFNPPPLPNVGLGMTSTSLVPQSAHHPRDRLPPLCHPSNYNPFPLAVSSSHSGIHTLPLSHHTRPRHPRIFPPPLFPPQAPNPSPKGRPPVRAFRWVSHPSAFTVNPRTDTSREVLRPDTLAAFITVACSSDYTSCTATWLFRKCKWGFKDGSQHLKAV